MNKNEMMKNRILSVSKGILDALGPDQLTITHICSKCAISRSTFYKYFSSKEELISLLSSSTSMPQQDIGGMRDLILFTAAELISKKGYDRIGMNDIAKEIGINRTSLYSYFSSISEIAKNLIAKEFENREVLEKLSSSNKINPVEKLDRYLDYHMKLLGNKHNSRLIVDLLENCYINPGIKEGIESIEQQSIKHIAQVIEAGKRENIFLPDTDAAQYAKLFYILGYGLAVYSYIHQECDLMDELKSPVLDFILSSIKKEPHPSM